MIHPPVATEAFEPCAPADSVVDGRTGVLFDEQSVAALKAAILRFESLTFEPRIMTVRAREFDASRFRERFACAVARQLRGRFDGLFTERRIEIVPKAPRRIATKV